MIKRILVGLGGTDYTISAINQAVALALAHDAEVTGVSWSGQTVTVSVLSPGALPPVNKLQQTVDDLVPWSPQVVVIHTTGQRESAG